MNKTNYAIHPGSKFSTKDISITNSGKKILFLTLSFDKRGNVKIQALKPLKRKKRK